MGTFPKTTATIFQLFMIDNYGGKSFCLEDVQLRRVTQAKWTPVISHFVSSSSEYSNEHKASNLGIKGEYWCSKSGTNQNVDIGIMFLTGVMTDGFRVKSHSGYRKMTFKDYEFWDRWPRLLTSGRRPNTDCTSSDCVWNEFNFPATNSNMFRLKIVNNYGYKYTCLEDLELRSTTSIYNDECRTKKELRCIFPFTYGGATVEICVRGFRNKHDLLAEARKIKEDEENFADWTRKLPNGMFFFCHLLLDCIFL